VAACVDLRDIRLWGIEAKLENVPDVGEARLSYALNADLDVQHSQENSILLVLGTYTLNVEAVPPHEETAGAIEASDAENTPVASVNFRLNALFEVEREPKDEPFSEAELSAFGETTGQFALYPYARELVADMTGRMGLPPLHLGVMRLHLDSRNSD